jgi:putative ABC transport system substrate-binding protein
VTAISTLSRRAAALVGAALLFMPAAGAQPAAKRARVAILSPFSPLEPGVEAFRTGLARLGWVEGQNLNLDMAWVHGRLEHLPAAAAEIAGRKPTSFSHPASKVSRR